MGSSQEPGHVCLLEVCCQGGDKEGLRKALEPVPAAQEAEARNRRARRQGLQMARLPSANPSPCIVLPPEAGHSINYSLAGQTNFTFLVFTIHFPFWDL